MRQHFRRFIPSPIWALFVPPLFGRFFLLARTMGSSGSLADAIRYEINIVLWVVLIILTGYIASVLAVNAGLSKRGHERFTVMAMLGVIAPPVGIAIAELSGTVHLIAAQLFLLGLLLCTFRLIRLRRAGASSQKKAIWVAPTVALMIGSLALIWLSPEQDQAAQLALNLPNWSPETSLTLQLILLFTFLLVLINLLITPGYTFLSLQRQQATEPALPTRPRRTRPILTRLRKLISLPLFLCASLALISLVVLIFGGTTGSQTGLLAVFALAIPFFNAAIFTLPYMITQQQQVILQEEQTSTTGSGRRSGRGAVLLHVIFLAMIGLYFCGQIYIYMLIPLV